MKSGPFIKATSIAYHQSVKTVTLLDRYLKQSGRIQTGGNGVNAPEMAASDIAAITIGLLAHE